MSPHALLWYPVSSPVCPCLTDLLARIARARWGNAKAAHVLALLSIGLRGWGCSRCREGVSHARTYAMLCASAWAGGMIGSRLARPPFRASAICASQWARLTCVHPAYPA